MFNRILVAATEDEIAAQVIATAKSLAGALGAQLALVNVVDITGAVAASTPMEIGASPIATQELIAAQEDASGTFVQRAAADLGQAEILQREGSPVPEIVAAAREWSADLVVIGTHGRGGVGRLVLGSVAEAVLREAPCPVLAVRLGTAPAA